MPRAGHVGDEQLDGIGADVNDGPALRRVAFHLDWRRARTAAPMMPASSPILLAMMSTPFMAPLHAVIAGGFDNDGHHLVAQGVNDAAAQDDDLRVEEIDEVGDGDAGVFGGFLDDLFRRTCRLF